MSDLRKLRLEDIASVKEFVIEQIFCRLISLTLIGLGNFEKWVTGATTHLFPLLQVLIIRDCPKLLELPFSNHIVYPPEQNCNVDWFPKLQKLEIEKCPEFLLVALIPWTETLCSVKIEDVKLIQKLVYSKSSNGARLAASEIKGAQLEITGKNDLHSLDQVLAFSNLIELESLTLEKCPHLGLKRLLMLTSLKTLITKNSDALVGPLGGQGDVEWQLPVEHLEVCNLCGATGRELTELLPHLPRLFTLKINECEKITQLVVGVDLQQTTSVATRRQSWSWWFRQLFFLMDVTSAAEPAVEQEKEEDGHIFLPTHLSDTLQELFIYRCPELVLVEPPTLLLDGHNKIGGGGGGGLQALRSLQRLTVLLSPEFLSFSSPSCLLFPSSLKHLQLGHVKGMGTLEPLSNLTSLTQLHIKYCGENLRCEGLQPLLTTGGQLSELTIVGNPGFFAGWDPNPRQVLQDKEGGGGEQQLQLVSSPSSSTLWYLETDDVVGLLAAPICSLLSSSLTMLWLLGFEEMEHFTNEQEDALHLLASLQELSITNSNKLQQLPTGLHKLANLKKLTVSFCRAVQSLPKDGLPKSLQVLVSYGNNEELQQQCKGLVGTIPKIRLLD